MARYEQTKAPDAVSKIRGTLVYRSHCEIGNIFHFNHYC